ncbi:FAD-linked oxidase C-terminal domain-containing protein [uncultured Albimonas sp.]|uniref:FAD-binding oxidoreductase n=1 Tax=uncultured Albimonas sp. TaxID=1331701 RepID=UPI0030EDBB89|tara:strand:+ start:62 stop:1435 length:1374 start_codon:yes stop_codon:yes gene_type:complete
MTIQTAIEQLRTLLGERLSTADSVRDLHGRDESWHPDVLPDAVAFPETTQEVSEIVKICAAQGCPIVAWGIGSSLEGHALATQGGLSLDMTRMDRVLEVHVEDMDAVVQPGLTREALNEHLRATGLFFSVDPGANATLGGMAATRASGTNAVRYGTMRDNVLALEAVMADGRIVRAGSRARKSSTGYDLKGLLVGSEGTLGIITELTVKLWGTPEGISAATCAFADPEGAVAAVIQTIQMGVPMARIEYVDAWSIAAVNAWAKMSLPETPHLFVEFHGTPEGVKEQAEIFGEIAAEHGGGDFKWTTNAEERAKLWHARHNFFYAGRAQRPGWKGISTDVCVPISRLAEAVTEARRDMESSGVAGGIIGHVGDGNFHAGLFFRPEHPGELETVKAVAGRMAETALRLGGTVSGEHGIGVGKKRFMDAEHGEAVSVMAQIKRALDPQGILNPGKMLDLN